MSKNIDELQNRALETVSAMVKETATQCMQHLEKKKRKLQENLQQESEASKFASLQNAEEVPEAQINVERAKARERMAQARANETAIEYISRLESDRLRKSELRARETSEEHEARLQRQREAYALRKQAEGFHEKQLNIERPKARERMAQARANETAYQYISRLESDRLRKSESRAKETSLEREARLRRQREAYARRKLAEEVSEKQCNVEGKNTKQLLAQAILNETVEHISRISAYQYICRLESDRLRKSESRAKETSEKREARLRRQREAYALRKQTEEVPEQQLNVERAKAKERMAQARLNETEEARASRLAKDAQRHAQARANETADAYTSRLEADRLRNAELRARETSQEHEARLRRQREAYARRKLAEKVSEKQCKVEGANVKEQMAQVRFNEMVEHISLLKSDQFRNSELRAREISQEGEAKLQRQHEVYAQQVADQVLLPKMNYPIHPDVKFKRLPFFDILSELVKPSTLIPQNNSRQQDCSFYFYLTPQQVMDIASSRDLQHGGCSKFIKQIQMRFCLMETSCKQEDFFPPDIVVKVNNIQFALPKPIPTNKPFEEPKRPPRPLNITQLINLSPTAPNTIHVSWTHDYGRAYAITVALVHKKNSMDLLQRMKTCGPKHSDHTRGLIKEKLYEDGDSDIATTSLRVSLMCPLGKMRMANPCRAQTCQHLQCFDAFLYLQMNEKKPTWNCPVCDKPALYEDLDIDGYFEDVLCSPQLNSDVSEIQLHKDGSWSIHSETKPPPAKEVKVSTMDDFVEVISDDIGKNIGNPIYIEIEEIHTD